MKETLFTLLKILKKICPCQNEILIPKEQQEDDIVNLVKMK